MQNYFPATYQQYYPQQNYSQFQSQQAPQQSGITWVDGVSSAKAYPVSNGTSILLMDSNENAFYIKSADQSGMPSIRVFDYSERVIAQNPQPQAAQVPEQTNEAPEIDLSGYVTKEELKKVATDIEKKIDSLSSPKTTTRK
ncbi:hypothetical protein [Butyrivibrio sp. INlla21]|uniref:hypothetical protein n=1 Tax=Butyrivibrio sp. INlla21 TaxID=1520811 RepID=UPI0008E62630|nr:hypothetical protein [Butyrivibrio sp. INlla21]SFU35543.1 hypothetical protein SAMN02910342_00213 [Butyrivibrio sp. INlla21]